jgi:hypothetical protein
MPNCGAMIHGSTRRRQRGQTLVIFAGGIAGFLGMVALVVDGSNYYVQNRAAQKLADAASQAGATVIARALAQGTSPDDTVVKAAIDGIAIDNGFEPFFSSASAPKAYYTDIDGTPIGGTGNPIGSGMPSCTTDCIGGQPVGVQVVGFHTFPTLVAGIVGQTEFTVAPEATAVAGYVALPCESAGGCPLVPVTAATKQAECVSGVPMYGDEWLPTALTRPTDGEPPNAVLKLCDNDEGSVGWIDFTCPPPEPSIQDQVLEPCHGPMNFPNWQRSWQGEPGNLQTKLNRLTGDELGSYEPGEDRVIVVPFFDAVCDDVPASSAVAEPSGSPYPLECDPNPAGSDPHVRLTGFMGFILDRAYLQGVSASDCDEPALTGSSVAPSTFTTTTTTTSNVSGCLKGWFTSAVAPPGAVSIDPGDPDWPRPVTVQLIR